MNTILFRKTFNYLFYFLAFIAVVLVLFSLFRNIPKQNANLSQSSLNFFSHAESSSPSVLGATTSTVNLEKSRLGDFSSKFYNSNYKSYVFDKYFEKFNSPLVGHGKDFIDACESYGAPDDCLLMVAIAKAETNLCTTPGSDAQKNCWGFGGSGSNRIVWPSYDVAINEVTRRVMEGYGMNFFNDANNGKLYYCGTHCNKWGDVVNHYKLEISQFAVSLGFPSIL